MKVYLRENYSWHNVQVVAEESSWNPEFIFEMPTDKVMKLLEIQVKYEEMQQQLKPLFEKATETKKENDAVKKVAEDYKKEMEAIEAAKNQDEILP